MRGKQHSLKKTVWRLKLWMKTKDKPVPGSLIVWWGRIKTNRAKIRRAWLGQWGGGGGENGRESPVSPAPTRFLHFFLPWLSWLNDVSPLSWEPWTGYHLYKSVPFTGKLPRRTSNWYQRWLWRNATRISVWNISSGKTGQPFQMFLCSRKFSVGKTPKVAFHLLSNRISRKVFCKWWLSTIYKMFST